MESVGDAATITTTKIERPVLASERAYEAYALVVHPTGQGYFWLLGESFEERVGDGCVYPDLVPFERCEIVDGSIPNAWTTRLVHTQFGTFASMGPSAFITPGFHEALTNGDASAVRQFLDFVRKDYSH